MERCTPVDLPSRTVLYQPEKTPSYGYFMTSGIASVVISVADGWTAEVGMIGREGLVGGLQLLGPAQIATSCFMQLPGSALRIALSDLRHAFRSSDEIRDRVLEFVQEETVLLGQIAACHRLHSAEERLARWLLMAQDRTGSPVLNFTQEFLANMLGARRTTVTMVAGTLQKGGLIEYRRGCVRVLSSLKLEATACYCYQIAKQLHANLYKHDLPKSSAETTLAHARS
jgi:CRP-like cAMP-binding protein